MHSLFSRTMAAGAPTTSQARQPQLAIAANLAQDILPTSAEDMASLDTSL